MTRYDRPGPTPRCRGPHGGRRGATGVAAESARGARTMHRPPEYVSGDEAPRAQQTITNYLGVGCEERAGYGGWRGAGNVAVGDVERGRVGTAATGYSTQDHSGVGGESGTGAGRGHGRGGAWCRSTVGGGADTPTCGAGTVGGMGGRCRTSASQIRGTGGAPGRERAGGAVPLGGGEPGPCATAVAQVWGGWYGGPAVGRAGWRGVW